MASISWTPGKGFSGVEAFYSRSWDNATQKFHMPELSVALVQGIESWAVQTLTLALLDTGQWRFQGLPLHASCCERPYVLGYTLTRFT